MNTTNEEDDFLFDDCPLCHMMKIAEQEGCSLSLRELKSGFQRMEKRNGTVGGLLFEEELGKDVDTG